MKYIPLANLKNTTGTVAYVMDYEAYCMRKECLVKANG